MPNCITAVALVIVFFLNPGFSQDCDEALEAAASRYYEGAFDESIQLIERCLQEVEGDTANLIAAYRLLGLNYLAKENRIEARSAVSSLLDLNPAYSPQPAEESREWIDFVSQIKTELLPPEPVAVLDSTQVAGSSGAINKLLLYGGGGIATAAVLWLLLRDDTPPPIEEDTGFPIAPGRPDDN